MFLPAVGVGAMFFELSSFGGFGFCVCGVVEREDRDRAAGDVLFGVGGKE